MSGEWLRSTLLVQHSGGPVYSQHQRKGGKAKCGRAQGSEDETLSNKRPRKDRLHQTVVL